MRRARGSLLWALDCQVPQQPVDGLPVGIMVLPAGEVADVALAPQQPRRSQLGLVSSASIARRRSAKAFTFASAGAMTFSAMLASSGSSPS